MRTLTVVALLASLVVTGCGSNGSSRGSPSSSSSASASSSLKPSDITSIRDPVTVSWLAFKKTKGLQGKPRAGASGTSSFYAQTSSMSLINRAHPDSRKPISLDAFKKVLSNRQMGALLALLDENGFDRHATRGLSPDRVPRRSANGVITVRRGSQVKTLVFKRGRSGRGSAVPTVYVNCKKIIAGIFNRADQYQVYEDGDRVLGIERLGTGGGR